MHIVIHVKVRYPKALDLQPGINHQLRPVIALIELASDLHQCLGGHRLALLRQRVRRQFELGELRLPKDRLPHVLEHLVDQERPLLAIHRLIQPRAFEENLGRRRRDLGCEHRVAGVNRRLILLREPTLHRVPEFVRDR